jgi:RND family efflux transporter MFP subunit
MKRFLALVILLAAIAVTALLVALGPRPEEKRAEPLVPPVEFVTAEPRAHRLTVRTQGVVTPATETVLIPEVSGRIVEVSPRFDAGGFFEGGDVLLRIEPIAYEAALAEARARLAAAEMALAQEQAASAQAEQEWRELGRGEPSPLARREPQQARAQAEIDAARAAVAVAERNLDRTVIRAPFAGRVRETAVDLGQIVTANSTRLGTLYGIDVAEVRLPLSLAELGLLELPESYRGESDPPHGPDVTLESRYGSDHYTWQGIVERVEGTVDPRTRLVHAVAVVRDPYRRKAGAANRPPLKVGLFVEATITGREIERAFVLPRAVLVNEAELLVIDSDNRLRRRRVTVVHTDALTAVVTDGLSPGERINRTPIEFFIEGMPVQPQAAKNAVASGTRAATTRA